MMTPKVSIRVFQRMASRNLTLRDLVIDGMDEQQQIDAVAEAYQDEVTRMPVNRAARRAAGRDARRRLTIAHHAAWYRAEKEHRASPKT